MLKKKCLEGQECGPCENINQKIIRIINKECQRGYFCYFKSKTAYMDYLCYFVFGQNAHTILIYHFITNVFPNYKLCQYSS